MFQNKTHHDETLHDKNLHDKNLIGEESTNHCGLLRTLALGTLTSLSSIGAASFLARETYGQGTHDTSETPSPVPKQHSESPLPFEARLSGDASSIPELISKFKDPSVFTLQFGTVTPSRAQLLPELILHDGSTLSAPFTVKERVAWGKGEMKISWEGKDFAASTMAIKAYRPQPNPLYSIAWELARTREFREDTLLVRGEEGMLTEISGQVVALHPDSVEFQFNGESINAPLRKIEGIMFVPVRRNASAAGITVRNSHGTFFCSDIGIREGNDPAIILTTQCGAKFTTPLEPFELNRIAAKNHFFQHLTSEVTTWKPWSTLDEDSPLTLSTVPRVPIEVDKNSRYGGIILHGALKVHLRLRDEYEKVILGVIEDSQSKDLLSFSTENGPISISYQRKDDGRLYAEIDLRGSRELQIKMEEAHSLRIEPLFFTPKN